MKNGIIKIWVCRDCDKEYLDRPVMCTKCNGFEFYVKYGGLITDMEELTKLIESYDDDDHDEATKKKPL